MSPPDILSAVPRSQTLARLLERAAREKDRQKFLELLHQIGLRLAHRDNKAESLKAIPAQPATDSETFDLFSGIPGRHAVWRESITGLDRAQRRMEKAAAEQPGDYFIFYERSGSALAQVTSRPLSSSGSKTAPAKCGEVSRERQLTVGIQNDDAS